jgi:glycosyltransferase involved in cell wall biosynthesis
MRWGGGEEVVVTETVSVIIPVYDRRDLLQEALRSVQRQQSGEVREILVIDDGSRDGSGEAAAEVDSRVRVIRQQHAGRSTARNTGIVQASGDLIAFLDSDDLWFPEKLARQLKTIRKNPAAGLVAGHVQVVDEEGSNKLADTKLSRRYLEGVARAGCFPDAIIRYRGFFTSTVIVRRSVLADVGLFDPALAGNEDWELWLRIARRWPILVTPWPPVASYRIHGKNTDAISMARGTIAVARRHLEVSPPLSRRGRSLMLLQQARAYRTLREERSALVGVIESVRMSPVTAVSAGAVRLAVGSLVSRSLSRWLRRLPSRRFSHGGRADDSAMGKDQSEQEVPFSGN